MNTLARALLPICSALMLLLSPAAPTFTRDEPIVDLFDIAAPATQPLPDEARAAFSPHAADALP